MTTDTMRAAVGAMEGLCNALFDAGLNSEATEAFIKGRQAISLLRAALDAPRDDASIRDRLAPLLNEFGQRQWQSGRGVERASIEDAFEAVIAAASPTAAPKEEGAERIGAEGWRRLAESQHALLTLTQGDAKDADRAEQWRQAALAFERRAMRVEAALRGALYHLRDTRSGFITKAVELLEAEADTSNGVMPATLSPSLNEGKAK